jgi:sarcosine oxidase delta subunit
MREKKAVTREVRGEYRKSARKNKTVILDQFIKLAGYNRKYAVRLLSKKTDIQATVTVNGKTVVFKPEKKARPKNRLGKPVYTRETAGVLEKIWAFYSGKCGAYLSVMIRQNIDALVSSREPDFHITPEIRAQLLCISGRQIDRTLKPVKDAQRLRGISGTKTARETLLKQIPVRTRYSEDEAKTPGFCQTDTVHHCGDRDSGQFTDPAIYI